MTRNQESPWKIFSTCRRMTNTNGSRSGSTRVSAMVTALGSAYVTKQRTLVQVGVDALTRSSSSMCSQRHVRSS